MAFPFVGLEVSHRHKWDNGRLSKRVPWKNLAVRRVEKQTKSYYISNRKTLTEATD